MKPKTPEEYNRRFRKTINVPTSFGSSEPKTPKAKKHVLSQKAEQSIKPITNWGVGSNTSSHSEKQAKVADGLNRRAIVRARQRAVPKIVKEAFERAIKEKENAGNTGGEGNPGPKLSGIPSQDETS